MKKYRTIVADPPWHLPPTGVFNGSSWGAGRSSKLPYRSMTLDAIKALDVRSLADRDAHLYLWTINRCIRDAFEVAEAWGFKFSTMLTWCKQEIGIGLGGAFTLTTEHVLFCRRGSIKRTGVIPSTWFVAPRGEHSRKPDCLQDFVEQVSPGPYLELFARRQRLGWDTWGNECLEHIHLETAS